MLGGNLQKQMRWADHVMSGPCVPRTQEPREAHHSSFVKATLTPMHRKRSFFFFLLSISLPQGEHSKILFLHCALYSGRKTRTQKLHNSRPNLTGFRNGNYWLWDHWLSRQSSTKIPEALLISRPVIITGSFAVKATEALTLIGPNCFRGSREHTCRCTTPTWAWTPLGCCLRTEKEAKDSQRKRGLDCGFAAQILRENRQVTEPLCHSWTALK